MHSHVRPCICPCRPSCCPAVQRFAQWSRLRLAQALLPSTPSLSIRRCAGCTASWLTHDCCRGSRISAIKWPWVMCHTRPCWPWITSLGASSSLQSQRRGLLSCFTMPKCFELHYWRLAVVYCMLSLCQIWMLHQWSYFLSRPGIVSSGNLCRRLTILLWKMLLLFSRNNTAGRRACFPRIQLFLLLSCQRLIISSEKNPYFFLKK